MIKEIETKLNMIKEIETENFHAVGLWELVKRHSYALEEDGLESKEMCEEAMKLKGLEIYGDKYNKILKEVRN